MEEIKLEYTQNGVFSTLKVIIGEEVFVIKDKSMAHRHINKVLDMVGAYDVALKADTPEFRRKLVDSLIGE